MHIHRAFGTAFAIGFVALLAAPLRAGDLRLELDVGDLVARAKETVNITVDKNTLEWAAAAIAEKGGDAAELRQLMTELDGVYVHVLEFDKEAPPDWSEIKKATEGVIAKLDGPEWSPIISVTERGEDGGEMVRVGLHIDDAGKPGGLAILVLDRAEIVLVNIVGSVKLEQLARIGAALGKPGMLGPLAGVVPAEGELLDAAKEGKAAEKEP